MKGLSFSLFCLRISVFVVFFVWGLDKILNPQHASQVFQTFYFSPSFGPNVSYVLGGVQLAIAVGFLLGFKKTLTYGAILLMHLVSTVSSYQQYLAPYDGMNMLFFAALPMLAACLALFVLRDQDTLLIVGS